MTPPRLTPEEMAEALELARAVVRSGTAPMTPLLARALVQMADERERMQQENNELRTALDEAQAENWKWIAAYRLKEAEALHTHNKLTDAQAEIARLRKTLDGIAAIARERLNAWLAGSPQDIPNA